MSELDELERARQEMWELGRKEQAQYAADVAAGKYAENDRRRAEEEAKQAAVLKREMEEAAAKEAAFRATPEGKALTKAEERERKVAKILAEAGHEDDDGNCLPRWLEDLCSNPPAAGDGVHKWLYQMGRQLHAHFDDKDEMLRYMRQKADRAGRVVPDREIQGAIDYSEDTAWGRTGEVDLQKVNWNKMRPWPRPDLAKIKDIVARGAGLAGLIKLSPVNCITEQPLTRTILPLLFPGDPLVCMASDTNCFATLKLSQWLEHEVEALCFVVPSEMLTVTGLNMQGEVSPRCLDNTGPRSHQVVEFDFSEYGRDGKTETEFAPLVRRWKKEGVAVADACASLLLHLSEYLPLELALSSAGKSEHGWYSCRSEKSDDLHKFMRYAVSLGADRITWVPCQLVRMPDGTRVCKDGILKRQQVHFLNPATIKGNV